MRYCTALALGALALGAAIPAQAQSAEELACTLERAPDWVPQALMDDYLFTTAGMGEGTTRPFRDTIMTLVEECTQEIGLDPNLVGNYAQYTVTQLMRPAAREVLTEGNVDVDALDRTVEEGLQGGPPQLEPFMAMVATEIAAEMAGSGMDEYLGRMIAIYALAEFMKRDFFSRLPE